MMPPALGDYRKSQGRPQLKYVQANVPTTSPRAVALIYGVPVVPTMFEVISNAHGVADTATVTIPVAGAPNWSALLKNVANTDGSVIVQIFAGFPQDPVPGSTDFAQLQSIFIGTIGKYGIRATADTTTFECTSLATLLMVDKQTTLTQNMTTVQFVRAACAAAGLPAPIVRLRGGSYDPASRTVQGAQAPLSLAAVFSQDLVVGIHNLRAHDLIEACAEADDVQFWVDRTDGQPYYVAPILEGRKSFDFDYNFGLTEWSGSHSPQFSKNIEVEVRMWNRHVKTSTMSRVVTDGNGNAQKTSRTVVTTTQPIWGTPGSVSNSSTGSSSTTSSSGGLFKTGMTTLPRDSSKERYVINMWNGTPQDADQRATTLWNQLSRYEYSATFETPITPALLGVLNISTVFRLLNSPFTTFNSGATSLTPDQVAELGPTASASQDAPYYFQQRTTIRFEVSQGDGSDSPGFTMSAECVNHALPTGSSI